MFKALLLEKDDAGFRAGVAPRATTPARCPKATSRSRSSTRRSTTRTAWRSPTAARSCAHWPMVAGIDGAGTVLETEPSRLEARRPRSCTTAGASARRAGAAWRERARLKGDWLVPLPPRFTPRQAMAIGTAGYTAMLCVLALERARRSAGRRRGARHRRHRRRRQRRHRAAGTPRLPRRRRHRQGRPRPTTCASSAPPR